MNNLEMYVKKNIFRHSLYIGLAMLISLGIQFLFSSIVTFVLMFLGYSYSEILTFFTDVWSGYLLNTVALAVICTLPFVFLKPVNNQPVYRVCSFNSPEKGLTLPCVIFAFGGAMLANIITSNIVYFLQEYFGFEAIQGSIGDNTFNSPLEFLYTVVCAALVPALFEEFAFRGMVMGSLRKFGDMFAVVVSALLFALYHGNFIQIPFAFIVGILLGLIVVITNSIWPAVIAHFINNSYAVAANSLSTDYPALVMNLFFIIMLAGVISLIFLVKKRAFSNVKKAVPDINAGTKFFKMLFSPTMIVYIIIMIITALMSKA